MSAKFNVVKRPANPIARGRRAVHASTLAVVETLTTGKAIAFPDERQARNARVTVTTYLMRQKREDLIVRKNGTTVWVEKRSKATG